MSDRVFTRLRPGDSIIVRDDVIGGTDREAVVKRSIAFAEVFEVESWNRVTGVLEHGLVAARTGRASLWTLKEFAP